MNQNQTEIAAVAATARRSEVPYSALALSETYQARTAEDLSKDPAVQELRATILAANGLILHNLIVVERDDSTYEVCAGGRRWRALGLLVEDGTLPTDHPVPVLVIPAHMARWASMIENEQRKPMHAADLFASYHHLHTSLGWSVETIATANGVTVLSVKKLLALASVSPALIAEFRRDKIDMDCMQALSSVADHARQEEAWKSAKHSYWNKPQQIRQFLAQTELRGDSPIARYLTVAAYEKAGGYVRRDLFATRGEDAYLGNPQLASDLAVEKMKRSKAAKDLEAAGWLWVEFLPLFDSEDARRYGRIHAAPRTPTKAEAKQIAKLEEAVANAEKAYAAFGEDEDADEDKEWEACNALEAAQDALMGYQDTLVEYSPELVKLAGAVLHLDHSGNLKSTVGLVRPEERAAVQAVVNPNAGGNNSAGAGAVDLPPVKTRPVHSAALVDRLQAARIIALQAEVAQRPTLALCLLIQQMLTDVTSHIKNDHSFRDSFSISSSSGRFDCANVDATLKNAASWTTLDDLAAMLLTEVPTNADAVLPWLLERPQQDLLELLALLTSKTIYRRKHQDYSGDMTHADRLARAVDLDMRKWWTPTAATYLSHVSKGQIVAVVTQATDAATAAPLASMKKGAAAEAAEKLLEGSGWLPPELITPELIQVTPQAALAEDDDQDDAE